MASQNQTIPIVAVFTNLLKNLPRLILTNLLFAIPFAAFTALFWWISKLLYVPSDFSVFVILLALIPLFPFYAGIVNITAHMVKGEEKVRVCSRFFTAVKENFGKFLIHGAVLYVAASFSYIAILIYLRLVSQSSIYILPLITSILIALFFVFAFFYIPPMTVSFEIPLRYIYKNAFLMSFGELKKNFIALFGLLLLAVVSTTFLIACNGSVIAVIIVTVLLLALIIPAVMAFIINAAVYGRMCEMLTDNSARGKKIDEKIAEKQGGQAKASIEEKKAFDESIRNLEIDDSISDDEYVYFGGRMVKKSVIMKMKQDVSESEEL